MNWDYYESVQRFHRILDAQGISEALKDEGAQEGDLVIPRSTRTVSRPIRPWFLCN
jgi:hypothetical protein